MGNRDLHPEHVIGDDRRAMRLFLRRNQRHRAPFYGVVLRIWYRFESLFPAPFVTLCRLVNGSSGGAAFGLAGFR